MKWWSRFHKDNKGAALVAVVICMVFVAIIAGVVMRLTITNIQLKAIEAEEKTNFYDAEDIMNYLSQQLADTAYLKMQDAYVNILANYNSYTATGVDINEEFKQQYIQALADYFWVGASGSNTYNDINYLNNSDNVEDVTIENSNYKTYNSTASSPLNVKEVYFIAGYYRPSDIKNALLAAVNDNVSKNWGSVDTNIFCLTTDNTSKYPSKYAADFEEGTFTLRNVAISYTNPVNGCETSVCTDIVFTTPEINYDRNNYIDDCMGYSIITDHCLNINQSQISISGNVYAGVDGIKTDQTAKNNTITSDMVVTRGDISITNGSSLTIGQSGSLDTNVWANNLVSTNTASLTGDPAELNVIGNIYVADDTQLDGRNSKITLEGNYYGYNFRKNYSDSSSSVTRTINNDADYSSSIILNAKNSKLDLTALKQLVVAGRTYISRGSAGQTGNDANVDIAMGESVSVRTNQLIYLIDGDKYLDGLDANGNYNSFNDTKFTSDAGLPHNVKSYYLNSAKPITKYAYLDSGATYYKFYLNFKSEVKANEFFSDYYSKNSTTINGIARSYLGEAAISLDDGTMMTLSGNVYRSDDNGWKKYDKKSISGGWDGSSIVWETAKKDSIKYKTLQMTLTDSDSRYTEKNVRFMVDNTGAALEDDESVAAVKEDKSVSPLIDNIWWIEDHVDAKTNENVEGMKTALHKSEYIMAGNSGSGRLHGYITAVKADKDYESSDWIEVTGSDFASYVGNNTNYCVTILVDNPTEAFKLPKNFTEGLIVTTGKVEIEKSFDGQIMAQGNISFITTNIDLTCDESEIGKLFQIDYSRYNPDTKSGSLFQQYLKSYGSNSNVVYGKLDITSYLKFDNWVKNE